MDDLKCIRLSAIISSVHQPRLQEDDDISELANCIQLNGLKEPLKVLPTSAVESAAKTTATKAKAKAKAKTKSAGDDDDPHLMICGHRRRAALLILLKRGVTSLPSGNARIEGDDVWVQVLVPADKSRQEAAFTGLIENYRRKKLTPFELAHSYKVLV